MPAVVATARCSALLRAALCVVLRYALLLRRCWLHVRVCCDALCYSALAFVFFYLAALHRVLHCTVPLVPLSALCAWAMHPSALLCFGLCAPRLATLQCVLRCVVLLCTSVGFVCLGGAVLYVAPL